jgi:hypothetical protein
MLLHQSAINPRFSASGYNQKRIRFSSNSRTDRFGCNTGKSAQFTGKSIDLIHWRIQHNIDNADLAFAVRQTHSADNVFAELVQYGINGTCGLHIFHNYRHNGYAVFCHKSTSVIQAYTFYGKLAQTAGFSNPASQKNTTFLYKQKNQAKNLKMRPAPVY